MKKLALKLVRGIGYDIVGYPPPENEAAWRLNALKLTGANVVFDVGANEGQFASAIRRAGYGGTIVSFEPLTSARTKLLQCADRDQRWLVHDQAAIGDRNGHIDIHIAANSVSSSVLPMLDSHSGAAVGSAYIDTERVPIATLDSIASRYLSPESQLVVKLDTQGFEWQVLDGAEMTLQKTRGVICELSLVPLYEGQRLWRDIIERLYALGFGLWTLEKGFTDPRTGQLLQCDGVFVRNEL